MTDAHRVFLLSLAQGEADWQASGVAHADRLSALQWKLENVRKLASRDKRKHARLVEELANALG